MSRHTSGSQSSDGGGGNNTVSIPFSMYTGSLNTETGLGYFNLEMPLAEMPNKTKQHEYPPVLLEIRDEDQVACLSKMKQLHHENILGVHFFDDATVGSGNAPCIRAYTEMYTGRVSDLFSHGFLVNKDTKLVPSQEFQDMVSASLHTLDFIFKNDMYHGNFSWHTTLYHQDEKDGKKTLKLSNFEIKKNKSLLECQVGDVHALAHALDEVSQFVKDEYPDCKDTCVLIDDLAANLMLVTAASLSNIKEYIEDRVFFWDGKRKKSFYAYEIPQVWDNNGFLTSFRGSQSLPVMPWDSAWQTDMFLEEMKIYRRDNKIREYDMHSLSDFIRFISGMYTHQEELMTKVTHHSVDDAVHEKHPRLLLDLKVATEMADDMDLDDN